MTVQPTLFVSHGAPSILLESTPASNFLAGLGDVLARPRAILSVTAHWESRKPALSADPAPETVYDFSGFPDALYRMTYPAPGAPDVAEAAAGLLAAAGLDVAVVRRRGFDHGTWVPLKLAYPDADMPVAQMAVQPHQSADWHYRLGQALAPLRADGVLVLASGSATHNLRAFFLGADAAAPERAAAFAEWARSAVRENRIEDLLAFETAGTHAAWNHPTTEHFLPLFVALGAAGPAGKGAVLHQSMDRHVLAMDAYRFD